MQADRLTLALSKLFGQLDEPTLTELAARIAPMHITRGDLLYREGDPGTSMHFVLTGRLQVRVHNPDGGEKIVAYLAPGESVGEMSLFTGAGRAATVVATRDSTLGCLTRDTFDDVMAQRPRAVFNIARLIIGRLTATQSRGAARAPLKNIALVPITQTFNLEEFGRRLQLALLRFGTTLYLDSSSVQQMLGGASRLDAAARSTAVG